ARTIAIRFGPSVPKILSTASFAQENSDELSAWHEVARMCRRICLLRATGRTGDAARLQSFDLSHALNRAGVDATAPDIAGRPSAWFASAEERVADALALADVLAPLLVEQLQPALFAQRSATAASAATITATPPSAAPTPRPVASGTIPGIADFIEEM